MLGIELVKLVAAIGKKAVWRVQGMKVPVEVIDVKVAWGKAFFLIKAGGDNASKWVTEDTLTVTNEIVKGAWQVIKEVILP